MRVFAIPILRNHWAYYCQSNIQSTSRLARSVEWSSKKWDQLGSAEPNTWKRKLYDAGTRLMNQLDYQEWFLKNVPTREDIKDNDQKVHVYFPSTLDASSIEQDLEKLLREREPYHQKYMYYSAYWVPISCTFVIVPLIPNIPLAYNLFRWYSHYKAYKGAQLLRSISAQNSLIYETLPELDRLFEGTKFVNGEQVSLPDEIPKLLSESKRPNLQPILQRSIPGVLDPELIVKISHHFESPGMEVELNRARFQILANLAKERFRPVK